MNSWSRGEKIGAASLIIAVLTVLISFYQKELRIILGLDPKPITEVILEETPDYKVTAAPLQTNEIYQIIANRIQTDPVVAKMTDRSKRDCQSLMRAKVNLFSQAHNRNPVGKELEGIIDEVIGMFK